jgi:hypothetical protein
VIERFSQDFMENVKKGLVFMSFITKNKAVNATIFSQAGMHACHQCALAMSFFLEILNLPVSNFPAFTLFITN